MAVIALVKPGHPSDESDGPRINDYLQRVGRRGGGPYEDAFVEDLRVRLYAGKKARERLTHRDETKWISPELLHQLEGAINAMVDFEF